MTRTEMIRWEPFLRNTIAGRFNQLFDSSWRAPIRSDFSSWSPAVDIYDNGTALILEAELPGLERDAIDIRVDGNVLVLSGERKRALSGNESYLRAERTAGVFTRSFTLPASVDHERFDATYRDGILTLTMPKIEAALPRRIDVKMH